jgi:hypothetical protein
MLNVDVELKAPRRTLDDIIGRLEEPRPMLTMLGDVLVDYERDLFSSAGHGRWASDDPATAALKNSGRVLVDTGGLLDQLTDAHLGDEYVEVNQGVAFYGRFLRDGDRGMPRRDPAPLPTASEVQDWADRLATFILEGRR